MYKNTCIYVHVYQFWPPPTFLNKIIMNKKKETSLQSKLKKRCENILYLLILLLVYHMQEPTICAYYIAVSTNTPQCTQIIADSAWSLLKEVCNSYQERNSLFFFTVCCPGKLKKKEDGEKLSAVISADYKYIM